MEKIDVRLDPVVSDDLALPKDSPYHPDSVATIDGPAHNREKCPTCERPLPQPHKGEEEKVRKGWTIAVPVAELEDGADVLDTLLDECRTLFGHDSNKKVKYYTLSQALALVVQNGHKMAADA